ncbi:MAG: BACON domain-containing protein [Bacteroidales bacterium]|nr:BACON domain-containing protein [Bacteroidales bacterium]
MKKIFAICICLAGIFVSCKKETPSISLSQTSIEAEAEGGSFSISVVANVDWSLLCNDSWIKLKRDKGSNTVTVTVLKNSNTEGRNGQVKFSSPDASAVLSVSQKQQNTIVLDGDNLINITEDECTFSVDTKSNITYKVEIPDDAKKWLSVLEVKSMVSHTVTFHAARNTGHPSRSTQVNLTADKCEPVVIKITQMGEPYSFGVALSGISSFTVPGINNNDYPAKVFYEGKEADYSRNKVIKFSNPASNRVDFESYQLIDVTFGDLVGVDELDFSGM